MSAVERSALWLAQAQKAGLLEVSGLGPALVKKYGRALLAVVARSG